MSLYNAINGFNQAVFYVLPMLADRHPETYPRFRDAFVGKMTNSITETDEYGIPKKEMSSEKVISLYTRIGGGNRKDYQKEIIELMKIPGYIEDYDDSFDSSFATFLYKVPEEFLPDFDLIMDGRITETSDMYKNRLYSVFPKLKSVFEKMFEGKPA